jgi:hypothetical protein
MSVDSIQLGRGQHPPEGQDYVLVQVTKKTEDHGTISRHASGVTFLCGSHNDDLHNAVNNAMDYAEEHGFDRFYIKTTDT